jgi:nicotinamidase-related amidase
MAEPSGWAHLRGGKSDRTFPASEAHGGEPIDPATTALVMIEFQNEFTSEGGKLHDAVKGVMASTDMMTKSVEACEAARAAGVKVRAVRTAFRGMRSSTTLWPAHLTARSFHPCVLPPRHPLFHAFP